MSLFIYVYRYMFMCCRKGSIIVDFELHYAGIISISVKESVHAALRNANGLKDLGAEFNNFIIYGMFFLFLSDTGRGPLHARLRSNENLCLHYRLHIYPCVFFYVP